MDKNADKNVDKDEFLAFINKPPSPEETPPLSLSPEEMFTQYDLSNDGTLD